MKGILDFRSSFIWGYFYRWGEEGFNWGDKIGKRGNERKFFGKEEILFHANIYIDSFVYEFL